MNVWKKTFLQKENCKYLVFFKLWKSISQHKTFTKNLSIICPVVSLSQGFSWKNIRTNRDCHTLAIFLTLSYRGKYQDKITYLLSVICKRFDILKFLNIMNKNQSPRLKYG